MLKDPRNLLWLIPLAALLTLPLWKPIAADFLKPVRPETSPAVPSLTNFRSQTSSDMAGVRFEQTQNGNREWLITADRLFSTDGDSNLQFEQVQALFFNAEEKKQEARIRSNTARYNADARQLDLEGGVVITDETGYEMQTETLQYHAADKKLRTTSDVIVKGPNLEVRGRQLIYDIVSGNYTLIGNVVCRIW